MHLAGSSGTIPLVGVIESNAKEGMLKRLRSAQCPSRIRMLVEIDFFTLNSD